MLAHSKKDRIGIQLDGGNETDKALKNAITTSAFKRFELSPDDMRIAFGEPVIAGWYALLVLDRHKLFQSLRTVYVASGAFLLFIMMTGLVAFLYVNRRNEHARRLEDEIHAAASIYMAMFRINLDKDSIVCVQDNPKIRQRLGGRERRLQQNGLRNGRTHRCRAVP